MNELEKPVYVSAEGLKKIQAELEELKASGRQKVAERIHAAMEFGDFTENSELEQAKNDQAFLEGRIMTLEKMVKKAQVIESHHALRHYYASMLIRRGLDTKTVAANLGDSVAMVDKTYGHLWPDAERP